MKITLFLKGESFQRFGNFNEVEEKELLSQGYRKIYSANLEVPNIRLKKTHEYVQIGVNKVGIPVRAKRQILRNS